MSELSNGLYCTFVVGDYWIGAPADRIQEVAGPQPVRAVPGSPREVRGLLNLRGQIVTAVDLRDRLGVEPTSAQPSHVVVSYGDELVSWLVDAHGDVITVDAADTHAPPPTVPTHIAKLLLGVLPHDDGLLNLIDLDRALNGVGNEGGNGSA